MSVVFAGKSISRRIAGRRILLRCVRRVILAAPWLEVNGEKLRVQIDFAALRVMVKVGILRMNLNFATRKDNAGSASLGRRLALLFFTQRVAVAMVLGGLILLCLVRWPKLLCNVGGRRCTAMREWRRHYPA